MSIGYGLNEWENRKSYTKWQGSSLFCVLFKDGSWLPLTGDAPNVNWINVFEKLSKFKTIACQLDRNCFDILLKIKPFLTTIPNLKISCGVSSLEGNKKGLSYPVYFKQMQDLIEKLRQSGFNEELIANSINYDSPQFKACWEYLSNPISVLAPILAQEIYTKQKNLTEDDLISVLEKMRGELLKIQYRSYFSLFSVSRIQSGNKAACFKAMLNVDAGRASHQAILSGSQPPPKDSPSELSYNGLSDVLNLESWMWANITGSENAFISGDENLVESWIRYKIEYKKTVLIFSW